jgi:2-amino-4-hydroxy-6-hydroxymethyldihydropteridine diphosphokinase
MEQVLLAFGANLGNRQAALESALQSLCLVPGMRLLGTSSIYETEPVSPVAQGLYLNACALFESTLPPQLVLAQLHGLEVRHGRRREVQGGPRTLDLDLLLHGQRKLATATLEVPHPRMLERAFVMLPAAEVAPSLVHPVAGLSLSELAARHRGAAGVVRVGPFALSAGAS